MTRAWHERQAPLGMKGAAAGVDKAADAKALRCRGLLPVPMPMAVVVVCMVMTLHTKTQLISYVTFLNENSIWCCCSYMFQI